jgi:hypothetical protein
MSKTGCGLIVVAILMLVAMGLLMTAENTFAGVRESFFGSMCKLVIKSGVDIDKDHGLKGIAVFLKRPSICKMITGEKFTTVFQGQVVQAENPPKMECLTEIAAENDNPALCDDVEGLAFANTKIDCLYRVAAANHNAAACQMIGDHEQSRLGMKMNQAGCLAQLGKQ